MFKRENQDDSSLRIGMTRRGRSQSDFSATSFADFNRKQGQIPSPAEATRRWQNTHKLCIVITYDVVNARARLEVRRQQLQQRHLHLTLLRHLWSFWFSPSRDRTAHDSSWFHLEGLFDFFRLRIASQLQHVSMGQSTIDTRIPAERKGMFVNQTLLSWSFLKELNQGPLLEPRNKAWLLEWVLSTGDGRTYNLIGSTVLHCISHV